jgi:hypothetical protein
MTTSARDKLRLQFQSLVGSLNWLANTTRPDISTVVSLLAQHQSNPSSGHLEAAQYVCKYLSHTKNFVVLDTSNWIYFYIFLWQITFSPCQMQTGVLKMQLYQGLLWNYLSLLPDPYLHYTSIYLAHFIEYPNANRLPLVAPQKPKFMLPTNALSSFLNLFRY